MSPLPVDSIYHALISRATDVELVRGIPQDRDGLVLEAWAEGYMVGSLIIMSCITLANMRRGVLLHKLILIELVFGYWQGFYILFKQPVANWWLSVAAIFLNASWSLHNVISWMKIKPFLSPLVSKLFIGTIILAQPYWVVEIYANFTYFHDINDVFLRTRPWEALCRDPWWIAAAILLVYNIKTKYDLSVVQIVKISPRFAVMLGAMFISIAFIILDVLSVTHALGNALPVGINPFWKLSFVFKCLTDSVVLDDFKTALDRLRAFKISRLGSFAGDLMDMRSKEHRDDVTNANSWTEPSPRGSEPLPVGNIPAMPSPDGDYIQPSWTADDDLKLREKSGPNGNVNSSGHRRPSQLNRMPSRDRDHDEDMIDVIDHAVSRDERNRSRPRTERPSNDLDSGGAAHSDPATENSAVYMLRHQENWPPASSYGHGRGPRGRSGSESDTDLDLEYAAAVRQVTQESNVDYRRKMGSAGGSTERSVRGKKSR